MKRSALVKKGPRVSPLREQGLLVNIDQRVTFVFGDGRSIMAEVINRDGELVLACTSHPGDIVLWPMTAALVDLIPARIKK